MAVGNSRVVSNGQERSVLRLRVLKPGRKEGDTQYLFYLANRDEI